MKESNIGSELEKFSDSEKFYLGSLCKHDHDHVGGFSYRHISNGTCVTCQRMRIDRWHRSEAGRAAHRKSKQRNKSKIVVADAAYRKRNASKILKYNRDYRDRRKDWRLAYYRTWQGNRRARLLRSIPPWSDLEKISSIYAEAARLSAETGIPHEVDHIVPITSKVVCGLHVEANLRIITEVENSRKGNRWWPDMW